MRPQTGGWLLRKWSGIRESNPRLDLGKVAYYHYTNPALCANSSAIYSTGPNPRQAPAEGTVMSQFGVAFGYCSSTVLGRKNINDRSVSFRNTLRFGNRGAGA